MLFKRNTIFDIIKEADDDASETAQNDTEQTNDQAPSPEESGDNAGGGDDMSDDDFNLDTNLDDGGRDDSDSGGDDSGSNDNGSSSLDSDSDDSGDGETIEANTDMFASLTAEEQQLKIMELKKLYSELFNSVDDILYKLSNTDVTDDTMETLSRVTGILCNLKGQIYEYIINIFPHKSFLENDINYNRFLSILHSVSAVIIEIGNIKEKVTKDEKK